ncbi:hypothetical protein N6L27_15455 [Leisingera sp. SS27]|uniref:hypothetical protein n=1 Tax=Leisingera sp. SS27 TaxID=2979462 RepID=UPI00232D40DD|nr:hypothetical protein [Leisingera sp. SS27]MDC0659396.1 hypothetical protein [Leisingera sp. SS27]
MANPAQQTTQDGTSTASDLHQALIRLAEPARAALSGTADSLTDAVLREIRETMLPREITLCISGRAAATLTVAQRRIAGFTLQDSADPSSAAEDPETAAQLFAARLQLLQAGGKEGKISFRRRPCAAPQGAGTCSAGTLAAALAAASGSRLDHFRARALPQATAWLFCPRSTKEMQGDGPETLLTQLDAVRRALASKAARPASARMPVPKPDCLLLPVTPQLHILAASDGGGLLLLALPPEAARTQAAAWAGLYR